jgi:hypothetical protein
MPLDKSIKSVLVIGSGPIVIGQACEFCGPKGSESFWLIQIQQQS